MDAWMLDEALLHYMLRLAGLSVRLWGFGLELAPHFGRDRDCRPNTAAVFCPVNEGSKELLYGMR